MGIIYIGLYVHQLFFNGRTKRIRPARRVGVFSHEVAMSVLRLVDKGRLQLSCKLPLPEPAARRGNVLERELGSCCLQLGLTRVLFQWK